MSFGYLLIFISASAFGLMPIFALYAYDSHVKVTTLLFLRFLFAAILFFLYLFFKNGLSFISKKQLLSLILLGGVLYTLQSTFYFSAVKFIPASLAALLLYLYPVFVSILSFFVNKEKISKSLYVSIFISLFGMVFVLGSPNGNYNLKGILLAFGAAIVYSIYIIVGGRITSTLSPLLTSAFISLFASISFLLFGTFTNSINVNIGTSGWISILCIALISSVIAMTAFFAGIKITGPTKGSILSMVEPVVTTIFSTLLFHDQMSLLQIFGGMIVLSGAVLVVITSEKNKVKDQTSDLYS
jgi:drug/metabolite transporter (DMT)-like permease